MLDIFGDRKACLAREITKLHEEYIRGNLSEILKKLEAKESVKGECSLFVRGCSKEKSIDPKELEAIIIERLSTSDLGTSALARQISNEFNLSKKYVYDMILKIKRGTLLFKRRPPCF